jgi:hypothetical protein
MRLSTIRLACLAVLAPSAGCIDVGHAAEVGCLVDMTEPGCSLPSADGGAPDATAAAPAEGGPLNGDSALDAEAVEDGDVAE